MQVVQSSPAGGSNPSSDLDLNLLDDFFGGQLVDDRQETDEEPDNPVPPRVKNLEWTSVGVFNGPEGRIAALSALKIQAGPEWFESKARKVRTQQTDGIPLSQTPRTRVGDGAVISEYKCPFAQVRPNTPRDRIPELPCVRSFMRPSIAMDSCLRTNVSHLVCKGSIALPD